MALGNIQRNSEQEARDALLVEDRNLLGVEPAAALRGVDGLERYVDQLLVVQDAAILLFEESGLIWGEKVGVGLADHGFARDAQELLAGLVEQLETQGFGVLDEDHRRNILDDGRQERADTLEIAPRTIDGIVEVSGQIRARGARAPPSLRGARAPPSLRGARAPRPLSEESNTLAPDFGGRRGSGNALDTRFEGARSRAAASERRKSAPNRRRCA